MLGIYNTMLNSFAYHSNCYLSEESVYEKWFLQAHCKQWCLRVLGLFEDEQGRIKRGLWIKLEYAETVLIYAEN